jgi:hypothetical protein
MHKMYGKSHSKKKRGKPILTIDVAGAALRLESL